MVRIQTPVWTGWNALSASETVHFEVREETEVNGLKYPGTDFE